MTGRRPSSRTSGGHRRSTSSHAHRPRRTGGRTRRRR